LTQQTLHRYRIAGKKARYIAELGGKDPTAKELVADLKRMQDIIGDWHDWMQLSARAAGMFGEEKNSALVAALRNIARAKFRNSLSIVAETRQKLSAEAKAATSAGARKPPNSEAVAAAASAA
jgi:CHAD domain-containing protein